jgi:geranylgeranyl transferase type-2 subunit beta
MDAPKMKAWIFSTFAEVRYPKSPSNATTLAAATIAAASTAATADAPPPSGFGGNTSHDPHLLYTLSALQIFALIDGNLSALTPSQRASITAFVLSLIDPTTGAVSGDPFGEIDTRFSYCAAQALALLGELTPDRQRLIASHVNSCKNFDSGYGSCPGAESHAAQVFCCVGALSICNDLSSIDVAGLTFWLAERQCAGGGLNGRPEKQADVCYSWWILSALAILGKTNYINRGALTAFILKCQDDKAGGIADRPDNVADVFHTFFGISGLSLMGFATEREIDPVFALPKDVVVELGLKATVMEGSEAYEGYARKQRTVKSSN